MQPKDMACGYLNTKRSIMPATCYQHHCQFCVRRQLLHPCWPTQLPQCKLLPWYEPLKSDALRSPRMHTMRMMLSSSHTFLKAAAYAVLLNDLLHNLTLAHHADDAVQLHALVGAAADLAGVVG